MKIVGFDLGHGETALALASLDSASSPEVPTTVAGQRSQVTALGYLEGRPVVGQQALTTPNVAGLAVAFKKPPQQGDRAYERILSDFLGAYRQFLLDRGLIHDGACHFYVGCPSGWDQRTRALYEQFLKGSGQRVLTVMPESRAAFLQANEAGLFKMEELRRAVLIIDIGSSTTDFTLVSGLRERPLDFGNTRLGAGLIDRDLLERSLAAHPRRAHIERVFEQTRREGHSHVESLCLVACRTAKERFFNAEEELRRGGGVVRIPEDIDADTSFKAVADAATIDELLARPQPSLGGRSWRDEYRRELEEVRKRLAEQKVDLAAILLTGGASRMRFTQELCRQVFPKAKLTLDAEPEFCIARGLARAGRWDQRAESFRRAVAKVWASGAPREVIENALPELYADLAAMLAEDLIEHTVKQGLLAWRDGKVKTLNDLDGFVASLAEERLKSDEVNAQILAAVVDWLKGVTPDLSALFEPITRQFHLPASAMSLEGFTLDADLVTKTGGPKDPTTLGQVLDLAALIAAIVVAIIAGKAFLVALLGGPAGVVVAIVLGLLVAAFGREQAEKWVKSAEIPHWMRPAFLSDANIKAKCEEVKPQLEEKLRDKLTADASTEVAGKVEARVKKFLDEKVEEAVLLIRS